MTTPHIVVVTGLSGAGKTTALHTLEDLGYFCTDNLPPVLAVEAVRACAASGIDRVGLGIDVRVGGFLSKAGEMLAELRDGGKREVEVLFLDASDEAILRRFSETRRPHPMSTGKHGDQTSAVAVLDGILIERERLSPLRTGSSVIIDTTHLSVHDLRRVVLSKLAPGAGTAQRMFVRFVSFGFKFGAPVDAELLFDVRFIENPYFVPRLKHLVGTNKEVQEFVFGQPDATEFMNHVGSFLEFVLPKYEREGKSYLTIGIGCTGGKHRSVAIAEALANRVRGHFGNVSVHHRDIHRGDAGAHPSASDRTSYSELPGVGAARSVPPDGKP